MKITRNTIRADGLTVGEALDKDAAFLRSVGIPAKDGAKPLDEQREEYVENVRAAVLAALDTIDGVEPTALRSVKGGWRDGDLPDLFPAIDAQAVRQFNRNQGLT